MGTRSDLGMNYLRLSVVVIATQSRVSDRAAPTTALYIP